MKNFMIVTVTGQLRTYVCCVAQNTCTPVLDFQVRK